MTEDILEAAAHVLSKEGLIAFNTNRIAEVAGISIGSLYQYFPNKESVLFRLQERELEHNWAILEKMLSDTSHTLKKRVTSVVRAFFESEIEELALRKGLRYAGVYFNETRELRTHESMVAARLCKLMREMLPIARGDMMLKARLVLTVVTSVAARVTDGDAPPAEVRKWAQACSDMLCNYLGI
jgi:AcrR family transcriptional regulator